MCSHVHIFSYSPSLFFSLFSTQYAEVIRPFCLKKALKIVALVEQLENGESHSRDRVKTSQEFHIIVPGTLVFTFMLTIIGRTLNKDTYVASNAGPHYWVYKGRRPLPGYPRQISELGLPDDLDAAVTLRRYNTTYFFKDHRVQCNIQRPL